MDRLFGVLGQLGESKVRSDDDYIDKLNHRYTTFILVIFAIVVSTKQYVGEPIQCWCPAQFTDNHEDFTNKICWVSNTYYVPISQKVIPDEDESKARIGYYQWVPMILLFESLLFYMPCMAWRLLNNKAGIDLNNLVETAMTLQNTAYTDQREKTIRFMAKHLDRYLSSTREYRKGCLVNCKHFLSRNCCLICGRRYGNYLVVLYLLIKVFYCVNVIGQLFLLNAFLGTNYHLYGYEVIRKLAREENWTASERFPRVTLCDFYIRTLGNIQRHTVQCVLPINLFNEKIYIFIWFWFVFVALTNLVNLCAWLLRITLSLDQLRYVKHHLGAMDQLKGDRKEMKWLTRKYVNDYLRRDGVFVFRLIGINTNELVVAELASEMFSAYVVTRPLLGKNRNRSSGEVV
ncbi:hypothetical protein LSH36_698g01046 [Paralvinella palmiformis]|uniref:Innexin n=1 Tax=Paralvinella palmiformis TaxID=53620 RepID=A0AAD9MTG0_9ANNE|nr:hypothetical protein LSH36_698g01046 [Paralvinella palmiformis]